MKKCTYTRRGMSNLNETQVKAIISNELDPVNISKRDKLYSFLTKLGFKVTELDSYLESNPNPVLNLDTYGINAITDLFNKVVAFNDVTHLSEEAAHVAIALMERDVMFEKALALTTESEHYKKYADSYRQRYRQLPGKLSKEELENKVREEILGKLLGEVLNENGSVFSRLKRMIKNLWSKLNNKFNNKKHNNELESFLQTISKDVYALNTSKFNSKLTFKPSDMFFNAEDTLIQKALKVTENRLKALKRRTNATASSRERLTKTHNKILQAIENKEDELGLLIFLEGVKSDNEASIAFIKKVEEGGNVKLDSEKLNDMRDYIDYYKPLIKQLKIQLRFKGLFKDNPRKEDIKELIKEQMESFSDIEEYFNVANQERTNTILGSWLEGKGFNSDWLDSAFNQFNDSWAVTAFLGSIKNVSDKVLNQLYTIVAESKLKTNIDTHTFGKKIIKKVIADLGIRNMDFAFEINDKKKTGYLVTSRNLGKFYDDYSNFLTELKKEYEVSDNLSQPLGEEQLIEFKNKVSDWLSEHTERQFTPDYYKLDEMLSSETREALEESKILRADIMNKIKDSNGVAQLEELSDEDYEALKKIRHKRSGLSSLNYEDGSRKVGVDLKIAEELIAKNKIIAEADLYKQNQRKFEEALEKKRATLSPDKFKKFKERNTQIEYDERFWLLLESIEKRDYGEYYAELNEKRRDLLKKYRIGDTSVEAKFISEELREEINIIDQLMDKIVSSAEKQKQEGRKFSDIAVSLPTEEYEKKLAEMIAIGGDAYSNWYSENHFTDSRGESRPLSFWTYIQPKKKAYIKTVPSNNWSEANPDSAYFNPNYDNNWIGMQPKSSMYKNDQYEKLSDKQKQALNYIIAEKREIDKALPIGEKNAYLAPQINQSVMDILYSKDYSLNRLKDLARTGILTDKDDTEFGEVYGVRPDGSEARHIPIHYTRRLEESDNITTDLLSSMVSYKKMASNYVEMSKIAPDIEVVKRQYGEREAKMGKDIKNAKSSNRFKMLETFVDQFVYGMDKELMEVEAFGKKINVTKIATKLNAFVRANNLIGNIYTSTTGYFNGAINSKIEMLLGRYTTKSSTKLAYKEYFANVHKAIAESFNDVKSNKMNLMLEFTGIIDDTNAVFSNLNKDNITRVTAKNLSFINYRMADYSLKSRAMLAVMFNYRLIDGKLITEAEHKANGGTEKDFLNYTSFYDMYDAKDGAMVLKQAYKDVVGDKELNYVFGATSKVAVDLDGQLSDLDKAAIHKDAVGQLFATHRGWLLNGIANRWKGETTNFMTGQTEIGYHRGMVNVMKDMMWGENKVKSLKELFSRERWDKLTIPQKQAVLFSLVEMTAVTALIALAYALNGIADDDEDNYGKQFSAYIANRTLLETSALSTSLGLIFPVPYTQLLEILNSPVAGTRQLESLVDISDIFWGGDEIKSGIYEGMTKRQRKFLKLTPGLNGLYKLNDPRSSNRFLKQKALKFLY